MIDIFNEIEIVSPVDKIVHQLRDLISNGKLQPGDKLPPERKLSEKLGVGRIVVREAIQKLEFYGMVKTQAKSGTVVIGMGLMALEGIITDVLKLDNTDFASLVDTRIILEIESAGRAAKGRTEEDITKIKKAMKAFEEKIKKGESSEKEDFLFHLSIASVSGNSVLLSLMRIISPAIIKANRQENLVDKNYAERILSDHKQIVQLIIDQNSKDVKKIMSKHLRKRHFAIKK